MIETRHGLLVEALVDAGFTVVPVNHLLERGRQPIAWTDQLARFVEREASPP